MINYIINPNSKCASKSINCQYAMQW